MMGELIVRNLLHRPLRTLIGVMAVQPVGLAKTGLLLIGYVLSQNTAPLNFAMVTEITPTKRRGAVMTMYTALLTIAGFIAPAAMGYSLEGVPAARVSGRFSPCRRGDHDRRPARLVVDQPEG